MSFYVDIPGGGGGGGGGGAPSGPAGGALGGTYPNPTLAYSAFTSSSQAGGTFTPAGSLDSSYLVTTTANLTIAVPSGSPSTGTRVRIWVQSTGSNTLTFNASIVIPTSSSFVNPYTITSGKLVKVLLEYNSVSSSWGLTSLVGDY